LLGALIRLLLILLRLIVRGLVLMVMMQLVGRDKDIRVGSLLAMRRFALVLGRTWRTLEILQLRAKGLSVQSIEW